MASDKSKVVEATGMEVNDFWKRSGPSQLSDSVKGPELGHLIRCLATDPNIVKFWWMQYTPYFNDGDVCEFGVGDLHVVTVKDVEAENYDDEELWSYEMGDYHPTLGDKTFSVSPEKDAYGRTQWVRGTKESHFPVTKQLAEALANALGGAEVTLLDWFGDHCIVTVTKDGITVDEYEHD